jgi:hypothetical protein
LSTQNRLSGYYDASSGRLIQSEAEVVVLELGGLCLVEALDA